MNPGLASAPGRLPCSATMLGLMAMTAKLTREGQRRRLQAVVVRSRRVRVVVLLDLSYPFSGSVTVGPESLKTGVLARLKTGVLARFLSDTTDDRLAGQSWADARRAPCSAASGTRFSRTFARDARPRLILTRAHLAARSGAAVAARANDHKTFGQRAPDRLGRFTASMNGAPPVTER